MSGPTLTPHPDVLVTDLQNELVLLHAVSGEMYSLNEVARTLWLRLPATRYDLLALVLSRYEVDADQARADLDALLGDLERLNMVQSV